MAIKNVNLVNVVGFLDLLATDGQVGPSLRQLGHCGVLIPKQFIQLILLKINFTKAFFISNFRNSYYLSSINLSSFLARSGLLRASRACTFMAEHSRWSEGCNTWDKNLQCGQEDKIILMCRDSNPAFEICWAEDKVVLSIIRSNLS